MFELLPFYWGNPEAYTKLEYLKSNPDYNTVFIGSSTIYRHIVPSVFDNEAGRQRKTFNMGIAGLTAPESYYLLENLLQEDNNCEYLFVPLSGFNPIANPKHLHTTRLKYYVNFKWFYSMVKYIRMFFDAEKSPSILKNWCVNYFESTFKIGYRKDIISCLKKLDTYQLNILGPRSDGYVAKENDSRASRPTPKVRMKNQIESLIFNRVSNYDENDPITEYDLLHLDIIEDLIREAEANNKKVIFMLGIERNYRNLFPLFKRIPDKNKLVVFDEKSYDFFYDVNTYYDILHFTKEGAVEYTEHIAESFNRYLSIHQ